MVSPPMEEAPRSDAPLGSSLEQKGGFLVRKLIYGDNSPAADGAFSFRHVHLLINLGNFLELINLGLMLFDKRHIDRDLTATGLPRPSLLLTPEQGRSGGSLAIFCDKKTTPRCRRASRQTRLVPSRDCQETVGDRPHELHGLRGIGRISRGLLLT